VNVEAHAYRGPCQEGTFPMYHISHDTLYSVPCSNILSSSMTRIFRKNSNLLEDSPSFSSIRNIACETSVSALALSFLSSPADNSSLVNRGLCSTEHGRMQIISFHPGLDTDSSRELLFSMEYPVLHYSAQGPSYVCTNPLICKSSITTTSLKANEDFTMMMSSSSFIDHLKLYPPSQFL
jgi:hypothetical protein